MGPLTGAGSPPHRGVPWLTVRLPPAWCQPHKVRLPAQAAAYGRPSTRTVSRSARRADRSIESSSCTIHSHCSRWASSTGPHSTSVTADRRASVSAWSVARYRAISTLRAYEHVEQPSTQPVSQRRGRTQTVPQADLGRMQPGAWGHPQAGVPASSGRYGLVDAGCQPCRACARSAARPGPHSHLVGCPISGHHGSTMSFRIA
jgi:hypothetical protein